MTAGSASTDFRTLIQDHEVRWIIYNLLRMADEVGGLAPAVTCGCHARGVSHGAEVRVWSESASRVASWGEYDECEHNFLQRRRG